MLSPRAEQSTKQPAGVQNRLQAIIEVFLSQPQFLLSLCPSNDTFFLPDYIRYA